ncbi:hypothetical protein FACS1894188_00960 [Clostridia bacterium]|nr:hypothetical protein FACS1894188_00960 [Clostridia bacterium]
MGEELDEETVRGCTLQKKFTCPVCEHEFTETIIRAPKLRFKSSDEDLHANYVPVDPILYDVVICPACSYAAMQNYWAVRLGSVQIEKLKAVRKKLADFPFVVTHDVAIDKYALALLSAQTKLAKDSEIGYIYAKMAWCARISEDADSYQSYAKRATEYFSEAYISEEFPICGMDAPTLEFLIGSFLFVIGNYSESMKWVSKVSVNKEASDRLKQRTSDLREKLKEKSRETKQ